jgi:hypothetical protein
MADFCMPMLIVNLGGEMVYILEQRLSAQNVPLDKSKRVLQDVIRAMYNPMFIAELFRPQDMYTMASTRHLFDRLAHSSIMRLNESSMDKLFDLMTMGFKYQLIACSHAHELLHVTLNHLYQLRSKVEGFDAVVALVDDVIRLTNEKYAPMSTWDMYQLKFGLPPLRGRRALRPAAPPRPPRGGSPSWPLAPGRPLSRAAARPAPRARSTRSRAAPP